MNKYLQTVLACGVIFGIGFPSASQAEHESWNDYGQRPSERRSALYVSLGGIDLNRQQADYQGVGEDAFYIKAAFSTVNRDNIIWAVGVSGYFYDDYEYFYHEVEDDYGDRWVESSDASSFNLFSELGYRIPFSANISFDLVAGYEHILVSDRSVSNCTGCYSEEIHFNSSSYISPRLNFTTDSGLLLGLSYQSYFERDIDNALSFNIGFAF